jgi:hypothetical protein
MAFRKQRGKCGVTFDTATGVSACATFEVLTAELLKLQVFWHVTPCRWVSSYRRFERPQRLHIPGKAVKEDWVTLKMTALWSGETSVTTHPKTRRHMPEELQLH